MDITQIFENIFVISYIITIIFITFLMDTKTKRILCITDKTWFLFYTMSVVFISIPIALIVATLAATILMYIL